MLSLLFNVLITASTPEYKSGADISEIMYVVSALSFEYKSVLFSSASAIISRPVLMLKPTARITSRTLSAPIPDLVSSLML